MEDVKTGDGGGEEKGKTMEEAREEKQEEQK